MYRALTASMAGLLIATAAAAATPRLEPDLAAKVDPAVLATLEAGADTVRVIVEVAAPVEATRPLPPRGIPIPRAIADAVAEATGRELEALERAFPGRVRVEARYRLLPAFAVTVPAEAVQMLAARPGVVRVWDDPVFHVTTAEGIPMIGADVLHDAGYDGTGTAVAIVDTGVDPSHPALGGGAIPNGKIVYGRDTADDDDDPSDCQGHGTAVASIAAGLPVPDLFFEGGVAPGAKILAYKASGDFSCGSFASSDVIEAIDDAVSRRDEFGVVAVNLSLGGGLYNGPCDSRSGFYGRAIQRAAQAGVAVVVSSGNDGDKDELSSPACVGSAISVGSVYDTRISFISYCGDETCSTTLCSDQSVDAGTPTCYSNTNRYLDVFAPSERLTAARRGGGTTEFGGTSGAAPYVTGALALLAQARPGLGPDGYRFLLELTGVPTTDPANGVTRPRIDLVAATGSSSVELPEQWRIAIPDAPGDPAVSTIAVGRQGTVRSVRVAVKIAHPDPDTLVVTLTAPDGTRVRLHDHGPGTTPDGSSDDLLGINGIYAVYPDEVPPAEDLTAFEGLDAAGTWTLAVLDDVAGNRNGVFPTLIGWALDLEVDEASIPPSAPTGTVPVAIHKGGAEGTFWVTDVRLFNPSQTDTVGAVLYLVPEDSDGTATFHRTTVAVSPRTVLALDDVVQGTFGLDAVQGNLLLEAGSALLASSRTYNTAGAAGTYGQFIGLRPATEALGAGDGTAYLIHLAHNGAFRTNLGFSEVAGRTATVRVTIRDGATGALLAGPESYPVAPFSNRQENRLLERLGLSGTANAYAEIEVSGDGKVLAYASVVDNRTGDAIYVPMERAVAGAAVVPVVARLGGAAGTNWVSDVRILNAGPSAETVTLEYRPAQGDGGNPAQVTREIPPGAVLALDDVVGQELGQQGTKGSLRVVPAGGAPLVITSRTYNLLAGGTYGQFVGAVRTGVGAGGSAVVLHLDKDAVYRSNVGVLATSGAPVQVRIALKDSGGTTLGTRTVSLGPFELLQIDDVFGALGAPATRGAWLEAFHDGGDGTFALYGSVVDAGSGDAILVPGAPLG